MPSGFGLSNSAYIPTEATEAAPAGREVELLGASPADGALEPPAKPAEVWPRRFEKHENWLGGIENDAIPLFDFLIERRPLAAWQATTISTFMASLFLRTRKVRSQI
jgi:hypothetical protein